MIVIHQCKIGREPTNKTQHEKKIRSAMRSMNSMPIYCDMAKLEAIDPAMFNIKSDTECLLCASEKIIKEFAIIAEAIIPKIRIFNVDL